MILTFGWIISNDGLINCSFFDWWLKLRLITGVLFFIKQNQSVLRRGGSGLVLLSSFSSFSTPEFYSFKSELLLSLYGVTLRKTCQGYFISTRCEDTALSLRKLVANDELNP
jgi:hypothetical protein